MPDASPRQLLDLFEHAPCGFHSLDSSGIFLHINETELRWLGYNRHEMIGRMNVADILTPEGRKTFEQNFRRLKLTGVLRDLEFDFVRKDETTLPVLVSATAVTNDRGEFLMSRSVVYDLTGRKQAENRFRRILDASPDAILICNRSGVITLAGGQIEKMFGYRNSELNGKSIETLLPESIRSIHRAYREAFLAQPQIRPMGIGRQLKALRADGTEIPVQVSLSTIGSDGGLSTIAVVRDMTDRTSAEDQLRQSEARFRSVVTAMAEGVVVQEGDGTISGCNKSAERILGLTEQQILGRSSVDPRWKAIREDGSDFPGDQHPSMVALKTGQRQLNVCMGLYKAKAETTWILINAEPIFHPGTKSPHAVVTTFSDITERKSLEEQLAQAQKLEAIGRLAGGVAHDFNNTIGVILGHCDLMAEKIGSDASLRLHATAIRKSAEHAAGLTRQLLAFGRKQVMRMCPVDLNATVRGLANMLKRLIGENIELLLDLAPDLGWANADPVQIEQVVMNLIVNARDAMPNGGRISVVTANAELDRDYVASHPPLKAGSYVMIAVSDSGTGMDEATLSHLFEPFFTTKEMGRGTGLGLSIIYGIVQQSNGHILVYSEPGVGSTFKVYLRKIEKSDTKLPDLPPAETLTKQRATILLVEDDPELREMLCSMLAPSGYTILSAATAQEALAISEKRSETIEVLLSDMMLKGSINGLELSREIKAARPQIKVLIVSGYSESLLSDSPHAKDAAADFLAKPFSSRQLREKVQQLLNRI